MNDRRINKLNEWVKGELLQKLTFGVLLQGAELYFMHSFVLLMWDSSDETYFTFLIDAFLKINYFGVAKVKTTSTRLHQVQTAAANANM